MRSVMNVKTSSLGSVQSKRPCSSSMKPSSDMFVTYISLPMGPEPYRRAGAVRAAGPRVRSPSGGSEPGPEPFGDAPHGVVGFGHVAGGHLEHVLHLGEDVEPALHPVVPRPLGQSGRVVQQHLVAADLDVERAQ